MMGEPPADGIKLHIGGWEQREGWKILDAIPGPIVDYVGNCTDLTFLDDESCCEVYASHVFEHLGYNGELQSASKVSTASSNRAAGSGRRSPTWKYCARYMSTPTSRLKGALTLCG